MQEAEQRLAQLREYVLTLEHKLAAAAGSADEAQGMRQEVIKMHKQVGAVQRSLSHVLGYRGTGCLRQGAIRLGIVVMPRD